MKFLLPPPEPILLRMHFSFKISFRKRIVIQYFGYYLPVLKPIPPFYDPNATNHRRMTQTHKRASPILGMVSFIKCWNWRRHDSLFFFTYTHKIIGFYVQIRMKIYTQSIGISAQKIIIGNKHKVFCFKIALILSRRP